MKFGHIVEELLNELSGDEIHQKYYPEIPPNVYWSIAGADPKTVWKPTGKGESKIGRYVKILLDMYKKGNLKLEDLPKADEYLTLVYKHNVPLDSTKIQNLNDIFELVKKYIAASTNDLNKILTTLSPKEYVKVHDGDVWMIFIPKSERAACAIGVGTEWCTTWGEHSLNNNDKQKQNYYNYYKKQGELYIIINKQDTTNKYQFHFDTGQYMNRNDGQINPTSFLKQEPEIKRFFFPSLYVKVSKEQIKSEFDKIKILDFEDAIRIIKQYLNIDNINNDLVTVIMSRDFERLNNFVVDENLLDNYDTIINSENIIFHINELNGYLSMVNDVYYSLQNDKNNRYETIHDDLINEDESWLIEKIETVFEEYYHHNQSEISEMGIGDYPSFKNRFFENFYHDEKIKEEFLYRCVNLTYSNYDNNVDIEIADIEKYIKVTNLFNGYKVIINTLGFIEFLLIKNINSIHDNLNEVLDEYCKHFNLPTEYEFFYDYKIIYPTYSDVQLSSKVDDYFSELFENSVDMGDKCGDLRDILNNVINKFFKGGNDYSDEHTYIKLDNRNIDCVNGTIMVTYKNKDTGENYNGKIKVENLPSYVNNYKLFETIFRFKKNII